MGTRKFGSSLLIGLLLASACWEDVAVDNGSDSGSDSTIDAAAESDAAVTPGDAGDDPGDDRADGGFVLDCERGAKVSAVRVEFRCGAITVYTCKDLSNVVIEFEDGTRERVEGLKGHVNTFAGTGANVGKRIVGVWVKAGNNKSGDGPGYGERVDAPTQSCDPPSAGRGGTGGAGNGGVGGACVPGPDVSCGPPTSAGTGGVGGACVPGPDVSCVPIPTSGTGGVGGSGGMEDGPGPD